MGRRGRIWGAGLSVALLASTTAGWAASDRVGYAGDVLAVDRSAGRIVVGDMGPLLGNGNSEVTRRSIQVTPATEFVMVTRATGVAPSGWAGDYLETRLPAWDVKPGDFVSVTVKPDPSGPEAVKVTVVDAREEDGQ